MADLGPYPPSSGARPRHHPLVNPEHATATLREFILAWDSDDEPRFMRALLRARELLHDFAREDGAH
ncbi:MAG TPA: hypothetical protein VKE96_12425 [Vicinamibacterales bacterium]|nr:hypothetical protein [Vicinamibacterales bacterium]